MPTSSSEIVVAVLPFQNLSDSNEWEYFAMGFTEDLITDLSRFSTLQILSPHTTKQFENNREPNSTLGTLEAHYLVKGSFRYHENQLRINTQLIRTDNNNLLWADRFDEEVASLFIIQDQISEKIVSAIQTQINTHLLATARKKNTENFMAYEYWLKGLEQLKKGTLDSDLTARQLFNQALQIDPHYARAFTGLSLSYFNEWSCQLWDRWEVSQKGAFEYAQKAVSCDDTDYISLAVLGRIYTYQGEYEKSEYYTRRSVQLNPNDADNLIMLATNLVFLGYSGEAEKLYLKALRINPLHPDYYYGCGIFIYFERGEDTQSIALAAKASHESMWVDLPVFIAAAFFNLNDVQNSLFYWNLFLKQYQEKILHGKEVDIKNAIRWVLHANPFRHGSRVRSFLEYMGRSPISWSYVKSEMAIALPIYNIFKKENEMWEMAFEGKTIFLSEVKGYIDLAHLIAHSGKSIHCAELMGTVLEQDDHYFVLDDKAKKEYQKRVNALLKAIEEADEAQHSEMASELREQYEKLVDTLSSSLGLKGKSRKIGSAQERTRTAVTWRIRSAIQKIEKAHPTLGKHLSKSIETGLFCSYTPEKELDWVL